MAPSWVRRTCIGKGSFGTVSLAVDKFDGGVFAVKSVEQRSGDPFNQALENEIRILKSLSSPYVVEYLGDDVTCEFSSAVYRNLHMEYMPGGTVADVETHRDDVTIRHYTRCIVSALSYIHAKNIVHCDVKGKNVLVGTTPGTAKLADFGSAIEMDSPNSGPRGSPLWMAPEVVRGEYQGPESDVWSLGCTVIEMVTGKPAWQDRGADTLCRIGYSNELPEFLTRLSDESPELSDFLHSCLRRDRRERWSCDQLLRHPYLLSCSSPVINCNNPKLSPRCVFDWSDSNFSDEETVEIENCNFSNSNAKQRISKLASSTGAKWEFEGWEMVRTSMVYSDLTRTEKGMDETTSEYSNSVENDSARVSVSGRTEWEYANSDASYHGCTKDNAGGTSCVRRWRDMDGNYSCYSFVLLGVVLCNLNLIRHINCKRWLKLILYYYY